MPRRKKDGYTKQEIIDRDGGRCWICGVPINLEYKHPHPQSFTLDHIVPLDKGGSNTSKNIAAAHKICNEYKTNYLPWEFFKLPEGILYRKNGRTALLLLTEDDDDLWYIINKLGRTRNKMLKRLTNSIKEYLNKET